MGVMIVTTVVVAFLTLIGTVVWWMMMNSWVEKDRRGRGRHINESGSPQRGAAEQKADNGDGPIVMR